MDQKVKRNRRSVEILLTMAGVRTMKTAGFCTINRMTKEAVSTINIVPWSKSQNT